MKYPRRKYESDTNFDGKVIETTLKTKKGIRFVTDYDYDCKGRLLQQKDYRGLKTLFEYNDYGALKKEAYFSKNNNLRMDKVHWTKWRCKWLKSTYKEYIKVATKAMC